MASLISIPKNCQSRHIHKNNRTIDKKWCINCKAFIVLLDNNHCSCCGVKYYFKNNKNKRAMQNVLNHFISEYQQVIEWWLNNPQSRPIILELKHGYWLWQIELRWLAKYYCLADFDSKPFPTPFLEIQTQGKKKIPDCTFHHDCMVGKKISNRFVEYDKMQETIDYIRPYLRKVDLQISWGRQHIRHK